MKIKNVEFKAKVEDLERFKEILEQLGAEFIGRFRQLDTYFNSSKGRLKLRESGDTHSLIQYERADTAAAKSSEIIYYQHLPNAALKEILTQQLGVQVVVDKQRSIYTINSVQFHLDEVRDLGCYIEVEAIDRDNQFSTAELQALCDEYFEQFDLSEAHLIAHSYSDLTRSQNGSCDSAS